METDLFISRRAASREAGKAPQTRSIADWHGVDAYVLLGEPGAGKSLALKYECDRVGGWYVTARDLLTFKAHQQAEDRIVFIDGIDEVRATSRDHDGPLDAIRAKLDEIGRPRFRLACREADWIAADTQHLEAVAPSETVLVLQLEPLSQSEQSELLQHKHVDISTLSAELEPLLGNPLLLKLVAEVAGSGKMPTSRSELYELACGQLVTEYNNTHRRALGGIRTSKEAILFQAGLLCAMLLIADKVAFTYSAEKIQESQLTLEEIPASYEIEDPRAVLDCNLFAAVDDVRAPRHRSIAEFLAARSIAHLIDSKGLPVERVLSLISGFDGRTTEPLRGLHAWLSVHCISDRPILIDHDPLGVVLYGDVRNFQPSEKVQVFKGLHQEALRFTWFRSGNWQQHPFGALGTSDMAAYLSEQMLKPDRDPAHQAILECILDAIEFGEHLPTLAPRLLSIVQDKSYWERVRLSALDAWIAQAPDFADLGLLLLQQIKDGLVDDANDEISGKLLEELFPRFLTPLAALEHFHPRKNQSLIGSFHLFWSSKYVRDISTDDLVCIADESFQKIAKFKEDDNTGYEVRSLLSKLVVRLVTEAGERASPAQLYDWLGAGIDKYGSARLEQDEATQLADWLSARPHLQKAVIAYGMSKVEPRKDGRLNFWPVYERLFRASRPRDWYQWSLEQAATATNVEVAKYFFDEAAYAVLHQFERFDISLEDLEAWVVLHKKTWPRAEDWLSEVLSSKLDDYRGEQYRDDAARKVKEARQELERHAQYQPHLEAVYSGRGAAGILHQIALAYNKRFYDIQGDTPEQRVGKLLGVSIAEAKQAIEGMAKALEREDLPRPEEIIKLDLDSRYHLLRPACLVGLQLRRSRGEDIFSTLPKSTIETLLMFALTDGLDESSPWLREVFQQHPTVAAPLFLSYARSKIHQSPERHITGIWDLGQESRIEEFARLTVPSLLKNFPVRATQSHLNLLNRSLIPSAVKHLEKAELLGILNARLALKGISAAQRISWLVGGLNVEPHTYLPALVKTVGKNQVRAAQLGIAVSDQSNKTNIAEKLPTEPVAKLVELLGPTASPDWPHIRGATDFDTRGGLVSGMISQLASSSSHDAGEALVALRKLPLLKQWKNQLDGALHDHTRILRAARFVHPLPEQVATTLSNQNPANSLDLASLTTDVFVVLGKHVRHGDSNGLKLFWGFSEGDAGVPRSENECRDVLLEFLRPRLLPKKVQVEKEAHAANEKRADLRVSAVIEGNRIVVPIELKKDSHRDLWTAWRHQLDALYANDPYAEGTGLYVVMWFGVATRASPNGIQPKSAVELETMLRAMIPPEDAKRIGILALDFSLAS